MIARRNRFHGHKSVSRVRGPTIQSISLSFRFAKNTKADYRLAVVVSKKVASSAVTRNRIRRRVFEAVRTQKRLENLPVDLIIYVKTDAVARQDNASLQEEILQATTKIVARL